MQWFGKDGQWLIIRFMDGHEARIGWQDSAGNAIRGTPFPENLDVRIQVPGANLSSAAGMTD